MVAIVPRIRILDGVRVHVPAIVVPVHVDRTQHTSVIVLEAIRDTTGQIMVN